MARSLSAAFVLTATAAALLGAVCLAAPAPKPKLDSRDLPPGDPVEPALDPAKVAGNPILAVKEASNRTKSSNNLKQITLAFHNYNDSMGRIPADMVDKDAKPLLSWRVQILPYIEEQQLYQQFKLDEPWDSENNLKLLEKMPKVFESPRVKGAKKGYTVYQGFSGPDAVFRPGQAPLRIPAGFPDGTSNTILLVEASTAVPWTKPVDIPFDMKKDLPDLGKAYGGRPLAAMMDGSVRILNLKKLSADTLKNAINPNDGQVLGKDWE